MSNIQTKLKTIVFTAISAAICPHAVVAEAAVHLLSAPATPIIPATLLATMAILPTTAMPTLRKLHLAFTNSADNLAELTDEAPIDPANVTQPLHTHFISSKGAQQSNPNVQIRKDAAGKMFQTDNQDRNQNGLISSIDFNSNDEVKMDGVVYLIKPLMATQPNLHGQVTLLLLPKYIQKAILKLMSADKTGKAEKYRIRIRQINFG